jgi:hypothetical protein
MSAVPRCVIRSAALHEPSLRRVLCRDGGISNVVEVYGIFRRLVQPNFEEVNRITYVCRSTCFATLKKLYNHTKIVNSLLAELGAPALSVSNAEERSDDFEQVRRLVVGR